MIEWKIIKIIKKRNNQNNLTNNSNYFCKRNLIYCRTYKLQHINYNVKIYAPFDDLNVPRFWRNGLKINIDEMRVPEWPIKMAQIELALESNTCSNFQRVGTHTCHVCMVFVIGVRTHIWPIFHSAVRIKRMRLMHDYHSKYSAQTKVQAQYGSSKFV